MDSLGGKEDRYVLVEYPFEYTAKDGQLISIQPNERYMLLRRTNDHWWHVRKNKEARPFYIPAKYVKELGSVTHTMPSSEELPSTTMLENVNLEASIRVSQEPPAEYEYRFVNAVPACEVDAEKAGFSSPQGSISSGVWTTIPFDVGGNAPSPISGASRATLSALSASHGSLKPRHATGPVGYSHSSEHIRSTVSLDDLAKFAMPPGQAGVGNLYKAASWSPARPLPKSNSETFHKAAEGRLEQGTPEPCARQVWDLLKKYPPGGPHLLLLLG